MGNTKRRVWSSSEIVEAETLIIKLSDASDSYLLTVSDSFYCVYIHTLVEILSFLDYFHLTHWAVELTLPQTYILQVAWRQGSGLCCAGFILNRSISCILEHLCLCILYMWVMRGVINLVYTYVENLVVVSFQVDIWVIVIEL